jgi:hypothetical protein
VPLNASGAGSTLSYCSSVRMAPSVGFIVIALQVGQNFLSSLMPTVCAWLRGEDKKEAPGFNQGLKPHLWVVNALSGRV